MTELDPEITPEVWSWVQANYSRPATDKSFYTFAALVETRHRAKEASSQAEIERLRTCLADLAEAARNACNAAQHSPLVEALSNADAALSGGKP